MEIDSILTPVKESQVVVVKPGKVDFKGKNITREKEVFFFFCSKGSFFQEDITILSVCNKAELQNTWSEMRQSCKRETDKSAIKAEDFHNHFPAVERTSKTSVRPWST